MLLLDRTFHSQPTLCCLDTVWLIGFFPDRDGKVRKAGKVTRVLLVKGDLKGKLERRAIVANLGIR